MNYRPWFQKHAPLFEEEKQKLEQRGFVFNAQRRAESGIIEFTGFAQHDGRPLTVVYPTAFPSFAPMVADTPDFPLLRRHHSPLDRQFCLFGHERARWCAKMSATDALDEVEQLLRESAVVQADAHVNAPEPVSPVLPYNRLRSVLVPPPISEIDWTQHPQPASFEMAMETLDERKFCRGVLRSVSLGGTRCEAHKNWNTLIKGGGKQGLLVKLESAPNKLSIEATLKKICPPQKKKVQPTWIAFVYPEESQSGIRWAWVICVAETAEKYELFRTYVYNDAERSQRIPGLESLRQFRVMLLGCGCLGSRIGTALAQSGINRFDLVDPDLFDPYNSVRHELGFEAFGIPKPHALAHRLEHFGPALLEHSDGIGKFPAMVGLFQNAAEEEGFLKRLADCDLVIETTGLQHVRRWMNEVCHELKVPAIYASVTNGAWGGEVFRSIPGKTACWLCWTDQYYSARPPGEPRKNAGFFPPGCSQPSFTGSAYETGLVAHMAAMMAAETLLRNERSERDFPEDYVRWRGRAESGIPELRAEFCAVRADDQCILKCGHR